MTAEIAGRWSCTIRAIRVLLAAGASLLVSAAASAHANGAGHLRVEAQDDAGGMLATWEIAAADLELPLALDEDGDGVITSAEILARRPAIAHFVAPRIVIRRGGEACRVSVGEIAGREREAQIFVSLQLPAACARAGAVEVSTDLFFGSPGYSTLLDVRTSHGNFGSVLTLAQATWIEPSVVSWTASLLRFLREGFRHVLIGYDHIAFLMLLLLPSVLRRTNTGWSAATRPREVVYTLVKIVTAFTIAHSISLGLAATGAVQVPSQPVEIAIAASIVVAGLLNLFPAASHWRLRLAFGFGLIHGFGFANALREIGADDVPVAPMLAGFNLGVETAQLAIVALALPVLWLLSRTPRYARHVMPSLSVATAMAGAFWLAGRL